MTDDEYPVELAVVRPGEELDWSAAERYLQERIEDLGPLQRVRQFPNGSANLTYLLEFEGRPLVLRRPPFGDVAAGAHDMRREHRVLSVLWRSFDRAPRSFLLCTDHEVVGADFTVSEYRPGQVIWGTAPPSMAHHADLGRRIGLATVDALADLHLLDPDVAGLADLGRPDGFIARQVEGWRSRWQAASDGLSVPLMDEVADRLAASLPSSQRPSILHNDFKIDNCQFDSAMPDRVRSVFDWDMATLGDPLVDVGILLNYWPDPSDGPEDGPVFPDGLDRLGLPTRDEVVYHYGARTGLVTDTIWWYEAFAAWKTGVVLQQLHRRYLRGETTDPRQANKGGERVKSQARRAASILEGHV